MGRHFEDSPSLRNRMKPRKRDVGGKGGEGVQALKEENQRLRKEITYLRWHVSTQESIAAVVYSYSSQTGESQ